MLSIVASALEVRHDDRMAAPAPPADRPAPQDRPAPVLGVRARVRAELTRAIIDTARRQLALQGPAALSLRAVARELGMVSSAVYRYVPSRDDLLTLLIIDAYDDLGAAVERVEARVPRPDLVGRFLAIGAGVRAWALAHPHEYALIYGSPVPGYAAPRDTIGPATRVTSLLVAILAEAVTAGAYDTGAAARVPAPVHEALAPLRSDIPDTVPDDLVVNGLMAWTYVVGAVSLELFGQWNNVIAAAEPLRAAFFAEELRRVAAMAGLAPVHPSEVGLLHPER
jgi:AcrR family transcriptional regulator